jgi:hypothetical protein
LETRFDAAYKAIMQAALASLLMNGYRPDTNRPGHHMTLLQTLPLTVEFVAKRVAVLDALRRMRNVADYAGEDVEESSVIACATQARELLEHVLAYRRDLFPELEPKGRGGG